MTYAFDEFKTLTSNLTGPITAEKLVIRYICALVSELAYHHVPQFEINDRKRALVVPCGGYTEIVLTGESTNVLQYLRDLDLEEAFVVVDRGIVAVGIKIEKLLFIGFRGTACLYDWKINLRASMVEVSSMPWMASRGIRLIGFCGSCRVHRGFGEEAFRVAARIRDEMRNNKFDSIDRVFFTGHSLGGAVAAIAGNFIQETCSTIIFGSPRYSDIAG